MSANVELKKVLISDDVDEQCIELLKSYGIETVKQTKLTKDQLKAEIAKYDGLIVRSATKVTADIIEAGSRLKVIGRAGTGVDNIDVDAATKRGIIVMNTPGGNTLSAAEHTCAMLMAVSRHVSQGTAYVRQGKWDQKKYLVGNELFGKTLAIIGLGRIGREVAHRMQAFGMKTVGFDPLVSPEESRTYGVEWLELDRLWPVADYITLHTPLIPQTKHLINAVTLSKCKKGVRVVNCARGGIIKEDDLLNSINSGHCAGAGLDVFQQEPPSSNDALLQHPLVTSTPHLGASTVEAQARVAVEIAQQFVDLSCQRALVGAINADALSSALSSSMRPWLHLATDLARLGRSLLSGRVTDETSIVVTVQGKTLKSAGSSLVAASLIELLADISQSSQPLNLISAPALAKSLGVQYQLEKVIGGEEINVDQVTLTLSQRSGSTDSSSNSSSDFVVDGDRDETVDKGDVIARHSRLDLVTLTGKVYNDRPTLTAINGATFFQPVNLAGSMLFCRCAGLGCGGSQNTASSCLQVIQEYVRLLNKSHPVSIMSYSTGQSAVSDQRGHVWGAVNLSQPLDSNVLPQTPTSQCALLTHVLFRHVSD